MNEIDTSTLEGKIAILTAFKEGKTIQHRSHPDHKGYPTEWDDVDSSCLWQWNGWEYRIKPMEFPKLPEGLEWHNKHGLTPEQVGEGWRLLTRDEIESSVSRAIGRNRNDVHRWENGKWCNNGGTGYAGTIPAFTYRIPSTAPFPEPPKPKVMVPLEPHDISPTDVLRQKDRKTSYSEHWVKIDAVNCDGPAMHFAGSGRIRIPFKTLMNEYEISRDGAKTWKPCEKESAS